MRVRLFNVTVLDKPVEIPVHTGSGSPIDGSSGFLGCLRPLFKLSFKTVRQFEELLKAPLTTFFKNFYCYCLELALICWLFYT